MFLKKSTCEKKIMKSFGKIKKTPPPQKIEEGIEEGKI